MAEASHVPMTVDLEPVQLVDPDGVPTAESRYSRDLPAETLCWLYEMMMVTRDVDAEFVNLQRQGELALFASCCGQEAAQVGAAACLRKTDWLFPQYRELGIYLVRGIPAGHVGAAWRGTWHGGMDFTQKCCAPISIPIGTQTLHAVGAAMAAQRLGENSVTVAFLGDGATSEGDVHEALNFAAVFSAPCVFYVQNNQWAISVPTAKPDCGPVDRAQGDRLRHAGCAGGRQRRAGVLRGDGRSRRMCPARRRADADRGDHVSAGPAHHIRRPQSIPQPGRARLVADAGPNSALPEISTDDWTVDAAAGRPSRRAVHTDARSSCATPSRGTRHRHRRSLHHGLRGDDTRTRGPTPTVAR